MSDAPFVPPGPAANWRQAADTVAFTEPLTIAEWWKNRGGESIRLALSQFQGRIILDLRTWYTADGKLKPGKGFAADIKHLPRLTAALAKAEAKARELHLISDDDMGDQ
jgi:Transcriptional Coactivator p15 (PC4)